MESSSGSIPNRIQNNIVKVSPNCTLINIVSLFRSLNLKCTHYINYTYIYIHKLFRYYNYILIYLY